MAHVAREMTFCDQVSKTRFGHGAQDVHLVVRPSRRLAGCEVEVAIEDPEVATPAVTLTHGQGVALLRHLAVILSVEPPVAPAAVDRRDALLARAYRALADLARENDRLVPISLDIAAHLIGEVDHG